MGNRRKRSPRRRKSHVHQTDVQVSPSSKRESKALAESLRLDNLVKGLPSSDALSITTSLPRQSIQSASPRRDSARPSINTNSRSGSIVSLKRLSISPKPDISESPVRDRTSLSLSPKPRISIKPLTPSPQPIKLKPSLKPAVPVFSRTVIRPPPLSENTRASPVLREESPRKPLLPTIDVKASPRLSAMRSTRIGTSPRIAEAVHKVPSHIVEVSPLAPPLNSTIRRRASLLIKRVTDHDVEESQSRIEQVISVSSNLIESFRDRRKHGKLGSSMDSGVMGTSEVEQLRTARSTARSIIKSHDIVSMNQFNQSVGKYHDGITLLSGCLESFVRKFKRDAFTRLAIPLFKENRNEQLRILKLRVMAMFTKPSSSDSLDDEDKGLPSSTDTTSQKLYELSIKNSTCKHQLISALKAWRVALRTIEQKERKTVMGFMLVSFVVHSALKRMLDSTLFKSPMARIIQSPPIIRSKSSGPLNEGEALPCFDLKTGDREIRQLRLRDGELAWGASSTIGMFDKKVSTSKIKVYHTYDDSWKFVTTTMKLDGEKVTSGDKKWLCVVVVTPKSSFGVCFATLQQMLLWVTALQQKAKSNKLSRISLIYRTTARRLALNR